MCFPVGCGGVCVCLRFVVLYFVSFLVSRFGIILKSKRELVALLLLSYGCLVTVNLLRLFLTVPWVGLGCVIVVFPVHTHFLGTACSIYPS